MWPKISASVLMTGLLLALGVAGSVASLLMQHHQSAAADRARAVALTQGDPAAGHSLFVRYGCGACHAVPPQSRADGMVGPPLGKIATRAFLAGQQPNDPPHLVAWVQHPQTVEPGVGMPDPGLSDAEAHNVAAYLYTLR